MYATFTAPGIVATVDSNDRERWATWGTDEEAARRWEAMLNAGTASRDRLVWTHMSDTTNGNRPVETVEDRTAQGRAMATLRQREATLSAEVAQLRTDVERLRTAQISGSDPRLTDFWERAQEIADDAEYCQVFDNMAQQLGGPSRRIEVEVTVTLAHTFTAMMNRSDYENGDYSNIDPRDYIDRYSIDISNAEIEEVNEA